MTARSSALTLVCAVAASASAHADPASPPIDAAIKTLNAIAADPAKTQTFCALNKIMMAVGDKQDAAAEKQMEELFDKLGDDFETAWTAGEALNENTPDGKEYNAALEALEDKCQ